MSLTVCFDFGNTRLKYAVFLNEQLQQVDVLPAPSLSAVEAVINVLHPEKTILSSVVHHEPEIELFLAANSVFHKLTAHSKLPFTIPVAHPETVGADRLAMVAAAVHLFPQQHNLIIGLGSCITFNFINEEHQFLGGSISPGLEMRFKSMHDYTALLPLVQPDWNFPLIGYDTRTNLLSGVIVGMRKEIDGTIEEYALRYDKFNVLLTGGDMGFFVPHLKSKIFADPQLIYKGLYAISEYNIL
jgi:type III pantothenate kinase